MLANKKNSKKVCSVSGHMTKMSSDPEHGHGCSLLQYRPGIPVRG